MIVDDLLPCIPSPDTDDSGMVPAFCKSVGRKELWMSLVEKAYAKYHGSYEAFEGGLTHLGLVELTGGIGKELVLNSPETMRALRSGALWKQLVQYTEAGYLLGAGTPAGSDTCVSSMGIVQGHAYAILRVVEESNIHGKYQLLQLRNPWAKIEWKGQWCDEDSRSWTRRMIKKLNYDPWEQSSNDGVFWMSFTDFVQHFASVYVCFIFKEVQDGGSWYCYSATGCWSGITAGGCPSSLNKNAKNNPQFLLQTLRPTNVLHEGPGHYQERTQGVECATKRMTGAQCSSSARCFERKATSTGHNQREEDNS